VHGGIDNFGGFAVGDALFFLTSVHQREDECENANLFQLRAW
jgi:hypothetical protein